MTNFGSVTGKRLLPPTVLMSFLAVLLLYPRCAKHNSSSSEPLSPIRKAVDLDIGEKTEVELADGSRVAVRLIGMEHERDHLRNAVRSARVRIEVNGREVEINSANYCLPDLVAGVRIDCPITRDYYTNTDQDRWGLVKAARLRIWPGEGPFIKPETFLYPVGQRILASDTQMSNEPCYVDGGEIPGDKNIYYHSGLDFGGSEGMVEVFAATDGLVVSARDSVLEAHKKDTPVMPRYDVVYVLDKRGWYYRYSHMHSIEPWVVPGARVEKGKKIGILGKEGGSGGWSHLHFEIVARQPSGKWGTEEAYIYAWQVYMDQYNPEVVAVARPHHLAASGETVTLDGSKSWHRGTGGLHYEWLFTDGSKGEGPVVERVYNSAGTYYEALKVTDDHGNLDYDFAAVQVIDKNLPNRLPPSLHVNYYPTLDIRAGQPLTFKVRSFNVKKGEEVWDFGDGSPKTTTSSFPCYSSNDYAPEGMSYLEVEHHPQGYAETVHAFGEPGHYLVTVEREGDWGIKASARVHVEVKP